MIPYSKQNITEEDIDSVARVLRSEWLTQGPKVKAFETALGEYCGAQYCLAVCNATAALHLACLSIGVSSGDIVLTSPITFVASANCAVFCGATVDFVDIDDESFCMDPKQLREKLEFYVNQGKSVKAVIPVHFAGQSCDMQAISGLAKEFGFSIIEDASHALGGQYHQSPIGGCQYSDITVFSFHPVKMITTGEGGAVLTKSASLYSKMQRLASHGLIRDHEQFENSEEKNWFSDWSYQQIELGFNYRITDIQCALGICQLARLDNWVIERNRLATIYNTLLNGSNIIAQKVSRACLSSYHLFVVLFPGVNERLAAYRKFRELGYGVNVHYIPVHTQPYYRRLGYKLGHFPKAEEYYRRTLSLPLYPGLDEMEINRICNIVTGRVSE